MAAAVLVSAGFFGASFLIPELSDHINRLGNGNLLVYAAMLLIFCLVFLGGMLLTERWETGTWLSRKNKKFNELVFAVLILSQMIFYAIGVSKETGQVGSVAEKYGWHTQPLPLMILLFLADEMVEHLSEIDYELRMKFELYITPLIKRNYIYRYTGTFDRIRQAYIRERMKTPAGQRECEWKYKI